MSCAFDETALRLEIRHAFGAPLVCVELTDAALDIIICQSRRWLNHSVGGTPDYYVQWYAQGEYEFTLPPAIEQVIDVYFPNQYPLQSSWPEVFDDVVPWFNGWVTDQGSFLSAYEEMPYSGLVQALQSIEMDRRILSADRDWEFNEHTKVLRLYPARAANVDATGGLAIVKVLRNDWKIEDLPAAEAQILRDWAIAEAKDYIGMARAKFGSWPVPGGERDLMGERLLDQAREEKDRLREYVIQRFKPGFFIVE